MGLTVRKIKPKRNISAANYDDGPESNQSMRYAQAVRTNDKDAMLEDPLEVYAKKRKVIEEGGMKKKEDDIKSTWKFDPETGEDLASSNATAGSEEEELDEEYDVELDDGFEAEEEEDEGSFMDDDALDTELDDEDLELEARIQRKIGTMRKVRTHRMSPTERLSQRINYRRNRHKIKRQRALHDRTSEGKRTIKRQERADRIFGSLSLTEVLNLLEQKASIS